MAPPRRPPRRPRGLLDRRDPDREPGHVPALLDAGPRVRRGGADAARRSLAGPPQASLAWALDAWRRRGAHVTTTTQPPLPLADRYLRLRRRLAALAGCLAPRGRPGGGQTLDPRHAAWLAAEVECSSTRWSTLATGLVRSDRHSRRIATRSGTARPRTPTRWSRCSVGTSRRRAGARPPVTALQRTPRTAADWALRCSGATSGSAIDFRDRLGTDVTSGEANVWPFHLGLIDDRSMLAGGARTLRREGYATPYPLKFEVDHRTPGRAPGLSALVARLPDDDVVDEPGLDLPVAARAVDAGWPPARARTDARLIERDGTLWEVLDSPRAAVAEREPPVGQRHARCCGARSCSNS